MHRFIYLSLFLFCFYCPSAFAQQMRTIITNGNSSNGNIEVTKIGVKMGFSLKTIPEGAKIDSSILEIVTASDNKAKALMEINLNKPSIWPTTVKDEEKDSLINFRNVDNGIKANTLIRFRILKDFIEVNSQSGQLLNVSAKIKGTLSIHNNKDRPGFLPRLVVYYTLPFIPKIDWASSHANAQHTASTFWRTGGASLEKRNVQNIANIGSVQTDLLMYKGKVLVVGNQNAKTTLYAITPSEKNIIADNLLPPQTTPAIDFQGRLYYITANNISVIELENGNKKTEVLTSSQISTVSEPPTVGNDGTLYLVMSNEIRAYSPFPENKLLWIYALEGTKSSVTLNKEGTTAYVVAYSKDSLIAINTNNGQKINMAKIPFVLNSVGSEPRTMPLVTNEEYIYVTDKAAASTKLVVFNRKLEQINYKESSKISRPSLGKEDTVFYAMFSSWYKHKAPTYSGTINIFPLHEYTFYSTGADASNNAYLLGENATKRSLFAYNNNRIDTINITNQLLKPLVVAPDGTLYSASSNTIYWIKPSSYNGNYTLNIQDLQWNQTTFRGNTIIIPKFIGGGNQVIPLSQEQKIIASDSIEVQNGVVIADKANVTLGVGKKGISFKSGFTVKTGATLSCKTGY